MPPKKLIDVEPATTDVDEESAEGKQGPYAGHPSAPPAQMTYDDDEWAGLPVQMRHDENDNPVF